MAFMSFILAAVMMFSPVATSVSNFVGPDTSPKSFAMEFNISQSEDGVAGEDIRIAVSGLADIEHSYSKTSIELTRGDEKESFGFITSPNGVFVSVNSLFSYMNMSENLDRDTLENAFNNLYKDVSYTDYLLVMTSREFEDEIPSDELKSFKKAFDVFRDEFVNTLMELDATKKIVNVSRNSLTVKLDVPTLISYLKDVSLYLKNNPKLIDKTIDNVVLTLASDDEFLRVGDYNIDNEELFEEAEELKTSLHEAISMLNDELSKTPSKDVCDEDEDNCYHETTLAEGLSEFEGSAFNLKITKDKNVVEMNGILNLQNDDQALTVEFSGHQKNVATYTTNPINNLGSFDVAVENLQKEYNKLDPINWISVVWSDYDESVGNFATVRLNRIAEDESLRTNDIETYQFYAIDGRIYLPMRKICEAMGEEVEWDQMENKAYVVRDNERIDMSGIIKEGTTYIKVRDFEKLGYKVTYKAAENSIYQTAIIEK